MKKLRYRDRYEHLRMHDQQQFPSVNSIDINTIYLIKMREELAISDCISNHIDTFKQISRKGGKQKDAEMMNI